MTTVRLELATLAEAAGDFARAWNGAAPEEGARIGFATPELLWRVLTAERWDMLKALTGQPPMSVPELARRVDRDATAVAADVLALRDAGLVEEEPDHGRIVFPYDAVHVDFVLKAA